MELSDQTPNPCFSKYHQMTVSYTVDVVHKSFSIYFPKFCSLRSSTLHYCLCYQSSTDVASSRLAWQGYFEGTQHADVWGYNLPTHGQQGSQRCLRQAAQLAQQEQLSKVHLHAPISWHLLTSVAHWVSLQPSTIVEPAIAAYRMPTTATTIPTNNASFMMPPSLISEIINKYQQIGEIIGNQFKIAQKCSYSLSNSNHSHKMFMQPRLSVLVAQTASGPLSLGPGFIFLGQLSQWKQYNT